MNFNFEHITLTKFLLFIFAVVVTMILASTYSTVMNNIFRNRRRLLAKWLSKTGKYLIYAGGFYFSLTKIINFNLPAALAALGVLGAFFFVPTIPVLQNIIAGIFVTFSRPIKDGEYIDIGGEICRVEEISIIKTKLWTLDGKIIYVPNLSLITGNITNYSRGRFNKVLLEFIFKATSDFDEVCKLLKDICIKSPHIMPDSKNQKSLGILKYFIEQEDKYKLKPVCYIKSVSSSKIHINLTFWIADISKREAIITSFHKTLMEKLKSSTVELAE